ncbi:glycosyltransferase family 2 protein [Sphingobium sp. JS3065]|uniref:glycosyltransferase family 2 protein n=1 Tax=Sphingobium sp. JS3065 TaxID=2970925 RepID=UPI0022649FDC|nr:glycosyltransferase family A protein [Sphingobium sp. JS3065]UZW56607.1 glycosyltransferase family 2 protein [Sphingobium sp. JS3065]
MARVDVIMPVRDGEAYIGEAVRSVIAQTERDWRLIILNHASGDGTAGIIDRLCREDARIQTVAFGPEMTVSDVRNAGLALCDAPFSMMHDADDASLPGRMALQLALLEAQPGLVLAGGSYHIMDGNGALLSSRTLPSDPRRLSTAYLFSNPVAHPTVMLRTGAFSDLGLRYGRSELAVRYGIAPMELTNFAEDYLLFGQLAVLGLCGNVPVPVLRYRRHAGATSVMNFDRQMELSADISRHLMELVAAHHGVSWHDPVPFCNHGGRLYSDASPQDLAARWTEMEGAILAAFGDAPGVRRELAFRRVLATRRLPLTLARFARFLTRHRPDSDEAETMRNIVKDFVTRKPAMTAPLMHAAA